MGNIIDLDMIITPEKYIGTYMGINEIEKYLNEIGESIDLYFSRAMNLEEFTILISAETMYIISDSIEKYIYYNFAPQNPIFCVDIYRKFMILICEKCRRNLEPSKWIIDTSTGSISFQFKPLNSHITSVLRNIFLSRNTPVNILHRLMTTAHEQKNPVDFANKVTWHLEGNNLSIGYPLQ